MTCKVNADTTNGLKLTSDTSGEIDLQTNGTTKVHMDSSGNVGIGTSSPNYPLDIEAGALGGTSGDTINLLELYHTNSNGSYLRFEGLRTSTGSDWQSAGTRIQQVIDVTDHGYIQFNGDSNNEGISFGRGTSTEHMRIDSSGRVTIASIPSFLASGSSGTNATVSANNQFSFGSTDYNTGSHYSTANSRFTCPVSGLYWFYVSLHADTDADDCRPVLRVNGADYSITVDAAQAFARTPSPSVIQLNMSIAINLSANDYVELWARAGTGSTLYYQGHSWFGGYLIG